jgi:hypothetical protein
MAVDDCIFAVLHLLQVPETGRFYARTAAQLHTVGSPTCTTTSLMFDSTQAGYRFSI